jgi:hypothetical protein
MNACGDTKGLNSALSHALYELLNPLGLTRMGLKWADEPRTTHLSRDEHGLHRQEVCFVHIRQAPLLPAEAVDAVRMGGGFHVVGIDALAAATQINEAAVQLRTNHVTRYQRFGCLIATMASPEAKSRAANGTRIPVRERRRQLARIKVAGPLLPTDLGAPLHIVSCLVTSCQKRRAGQDGPCLHLASERSPGRTADVI